jgi:hypothetical protein
MVEMRKEKDFDLAKDMRGSYPHGLNPKGKAEL